MNKKIMLAALLLVSVAAAVSGTDFEERITEKKWYRDYFNEVIYRKDRNIIVEYQPYLTEEENIIFYDAFGVIFWFDEPSVYRDRINWTKFDDSEYGSYISMCGGGSDIRPRNLTPICMSWRLRMCAFHRKSMKIFWNADMTESLHWMLRSRGTASISGLTVSICISIWKTEKHCMQHTVPMMNQKKRLCTKQSAPMNLT